MAKHEALPPAVKDIIRAVVDTKSTIWQRENAAMTLENISEACSLAAKQFRTEQAKHNKQLGR